MYHKALCQQVNNEADDYTGLKIVMEALQPVAGKVVPVLKPGPNPKHRFSNLSAGDSKGVLAFPVGSSTGYILSSEKTYKRAFPALTGTLCWGAGSERCPRKVCFHTILHLMYFNFGTLVPLRYQMRTNRPAVFRWSLCRADRDDCARL